MHERIYFITNHFSLNTINNLIQERGIEKITSEQEFRDLQMGRK